MQGRMNIVGRIEIVSGYRGQISWKNLYREGDFKFSRKFAWVKGAPLPTSVAIRRGFFSVSF